MKMEEKGISIWWYRLRGVGLLGLCCLLFFVGVQVAQQQSVAVSSTSGGRQLPVYCVRTEKKQASLTFDAAWGNEQTDIILNILDAYQVKATFFLTGSWVDAYPEDVKKIAAAGHEIGNHSQNHKNMSELSKTEIQKEILQVHDSVKALTGTEMKLFRPPYGDYDDELIEMARACGYLSIQWDVDSEDWKNYGVDSIIQKVTQHEHLGNGSIILMHNGADYLPQALETVITSLLEQGYELVPVSELVYWEDYYMDGEGRQIAQGSA